MNVILEHLPFSRCYSHGNVRSRLVTSRTETKFQVLEASSSQHMVRILYIRLCPTRVRLLKIVRAFGPSRPGRPGIHFAINPYINLSHPFDVSPVFSRGGPVVCHQPPETGDSIAGTISVLMFPSSLRISVLFEASTDCPLIVGPFPVPQQIRQHIKLRDACFIVILV